MDYNDLIKLNKSDGVFNDFKPFDYRSLLHQTDEFKTIKFVLEYRTIVSAIAGFKKRWPEIYQED